MPESYVILCIEMSPDDFAVIYSLAQRRGKDVRTYIRDLIREDATRVAVSQEKKEG